MFHKMAHLIFCTLAESIKNEHLYHILHSHAVSVCEFWHLFWTKPSILISKHTDTPKVSLDLTTHQFSTWQHTDFVLNLIYVKTWTGICFKIPLEKHLLSSPTLSPRARCFVGVGVFSWVPFRFYKGKIPFSGVKNLGCMTPGYPCRSIFYVVDSIPPGQLPSWCVSLGGKFIMSRSSVW